MRFSESHSYTHTHTHRHNNSSSLSISINKQWVSLFLFIIHFRRKTNHRLYYSMSIVSPLSFLNLWAATKIRKNREETEFTPLIIFSQSKIILVHRINIKHPSLFWHIVSKWTRSCCVMMVRCERIMRVVNYKSRLKLLFVLTVCWIIDYNVVCDLTRFQWCCVGLWSNPVSETAQTSSWCAVRWGSRITLIEPVRCSCGRANKIRLYSVACLTWSNCVRTGNINLLI